MLTYKTPEDFNKMMKAGKVVSNIHYEIFNSTKPGMTFKDLDSIAKILLRNQMYYLVFWATPLQAWSHILHIFVRHQMMR